MEYYNKNIDALKYTKKDFLRRMELTEKKENKSLNCCIEGAGNGQGIMSLEWKGQKIYLNSLYNPEHEADMWAKGIEWNGYQNVVLMFGMGNGYHVRKLVQYSELTKVIIYEPSKEIFEFVLSNFDISDILASEKVILQVEGINEEVLLGNLEDIIDMKNKKNLKRKEHPYYKQVFPKQYKNYLGILKTAEKEIQVKYNTMQHFNQIWLENLTKNLKFLKESTTFTDLTEKLDKDIPVILVSAGPSVSEELEGLRMAKNHLPILAVDRIVDFLMDNGVEPDGIFTIDAAYPREKMQVERIQHIPVFMDLYSSCDITLEHQGKKIVFFDSRYIRNIYVMMGKEVKHYRRGTTVSSAAFCNFAGERFRNLILVGQDLSFHGEYTHAGGEKEDLTYMRNIYEVPGINGTTVKARNDWYIMLNWYNGIITKYPETTVYDAKSHGAKIAHTINIRLKEYMEKKQWEQRDFQKLFSEIKPTFAVDEWEEVLKALQQGLNDLKLGKEKAEEVIICCQQLMTGLEEHLELTEDDNENVKKIIENNQYFEEKLAFSLLEQYIEGYMRDVSYEMNEKEGDVFLDSKRVYMATIVQMQAIQYGVDYLYPKLEIAIENMKKENVKNREEKWKRLRWN